MNEEKYLSKLRNLMFTIQGQSLKQVLLREATKSAKAFESSEHSAEEIFHALSEKVYEKTNELTAEESFLIVSDADNLKQLKVELFQTLLDKFQWDETLSVLLEDLSDNDQKLIKPLLENQYNYTQTTLACRGKSSYDSTELNLYKVLIPIVRRVYAEMPVRNLVGFQPLSGPVGLAFHIQYGYQKEDEEEFEEKSTEEVNWSADIEGTKGRRMTVEVVKHAVEAGSRKLEAGWTIEAQQDVTAMHDLNVEAEMAAALAQEIRGEITTEIIADLKGLAGEATEAKVKGSYTEQKNYLGIHINRTANEIARNTRRGVGNFIVVSDVMADMLSTTSTFEKEEKVSLTNWMLYKVGTLNGNMVVYVSPSMEYDEILVGYKGKSDADTGYINCPYIPLMSTGIVVHPKTFQPIISLMTRYGKKAVESELSNAKDYYEMLKVDSEFLEHLKEVKESEKNDE